MSEDDVATAKGTGGRDKVFESDRMTQYRGNARKEI